MWQTVRWLNDCICKLATHRLIPCFVTGMSRNKQQQPKVLVWNKEEEYSVHTNGLQFSVSYFDTCIQVCWTVMTVSKGTEHLLPDRSRALLINKIVSILLLIFKSIFAFDLLIKRERERNQTNTDIFC